MITFHWRLATNRNGTFLSEHEVQWMSKCVSRENNNVRKDTGRNLEMPGTGKCSVIWLPTVSYSDQAFCEAAIDDFKPP